MAWTVLVVLLLCAAAAVRSQVANPEESVNILGGTASRYDLSHGNLLPLVARPWGMNAWAPMTDDDSNWAPWFFHPDNRRIYGIKCTHQPSPWVNDYAYFLISTSMVDAGHDNDGQFSGYNPKQSSWKPYYFNASLLAYATPAATTTMELTATERAAVIRLTFPPLMTGPGNGSFSQTRRVLLKIYSVAYDKLVISKGNDGFLRINGSTTVNSGGIPTAGGVPLFRSYFTVSIASGPNGDQVSTPVHTDVRINGNTQYAVVDYPATDANTETLTLRIATSYISYDQAELNLAREVKGRTFDAVMAESKQVWHEQLNHVRVVDPGNYSAAQIQDFYEVLYSCMYRASLFPRFYHEYDASNNAIHASAYDAQGRVFPDVIVGDSGFWDAYRTVYPFLSLVYPETMGSMVQGWVNSYKEGGWVPKWSSPGYRGGMTGTFADNVLADAIVKNMSGFDVAAAYAAIRQDAFVVPPSASSSHLNGTDKLQWPPSGEGRVGLAAYLQYGYIPGGGQASGTTGPVSQAVSRTLNYALSDYAIAQAAKVLGFDDDYKTLMTRATKAYQLLWEPGTAMFRPKGKDGSWLEPFDEFAWGGDYTEAGPWQYRLEVPWDAQGLDKLYAASNMSVCDVVERINTIPPVFHVGGYGSEIHEMTEMAVLCWSQYEHDNQPVHHILYMGLAASGTVNSSCGTRARFWQKKVLTELYKPGPEMFCGDEDNGEVASWWLLTAFGLYALAPGDGLFTLGLPLFAALDIDLPNGKLLQLRAPGSGPAALDLGSVTWNGKPVNGVTIAYQTIMQGGELRYNFA